MAGSTEDHVFFPFRENSDLLNEEDIDYEGIPWRNSKRAMSRICKHKTRRGNGGNIWVRWRNNNLLRLQIRVKGNRGMGKLCNTSTIHSDLSPTAFFFATVFLLPQNVESFRLKPF